MKPGPTSTGLSIGRIGGSSRAPELDRLEAFIGRWMTEGETVGDAGGGPARIVASDIYQWLPGGHFIMHPLRTDRSAGVGGLEVIGFDASTGQYVAYFFDSEGNVSSQALVYRSRSKPRDAPATAPPETPQGQKVGAKLPAGTAVSIGDDHSA